MTLLLLLIGCAPCEGTVVTTNPHVTETNGMVAQEDCAVVTDDGLFDYAPCCPDGYDFLGISGDGSVLCEEACGP